MTRQKFYEMCVLKSFEYPQEELLGVCSKLEGMMDSWPPRNFGELMVKNVLLGELEIPERENLEKWGVGYLGQVLSFACDTGDGEFLEKVLAFLGKENGRIFSMSDGEPREVFYSVWADMAGRDDKETVVKIGDFLLGILPRDSEEFGNVLRFAWATGFTSLSLEELSSMRMEWYGRKGNGGRKDGIFERRKGKRGVK